VWYAARPTTILNVEMLITKHNHITVRASRMSTYTIAVIILRSSQTKPFPKDIQSCAHAFSCTVIKLTPSQSIKVTFLYPKKKGA
jgi:hypothetical protein